MALRGLEEYCRAPERIFVSVCLQHFIPVCLTVCTSCSSSSSDIPAGTALITCFPAFMDSVAIHT